MSENKKRHKSSVRSSLSVNCEIKENEKELFRLNCSVTVSVDPRDIRLC